MRNKRTLTAGLAVLAISLILSACGGGAGSDGGGIAVKVKFVNQTVQQAIMPLPFNFADLQTVTPAFEDIIPLSEGTDGASTLDTYYGSINSKVRSITPTRFAFRRMTIEYYAQNGSYSNMVTLSQEVDFTKNPTVTVGEIAAGTALALIVRLTDGCVEFPWPTEMDSHKATYFSDNGGNPPPYGGSLGYQWKSWVTPGITSGKVRVVFDVLSPPEKITAFNMYSQNILFGGNTNKVLVQAANNYLYYDDIFTGGAHSVLAGSTTAGTLVYVRQFSGITVPEGAGAVRFEIIWDLTDMIEQYQGSDSSANTNDDVFVLKKDFWKSLTINAVIE